MRILLVSDYYPPFIGGAHRQIQLLARQLTDRGHTVEVATNWQPGVDEAAQNREGIPVYRVKQVRNLFSKSIPANVEQHSPPFPDPVLVSGLRRIINRFGPDLVHSYGWITYSCAAALIGKKTPLIVSSRDYGYSCATRTLIYNESICSGPGVVKCAGCSMDHFGKVKGILSYLGIFYGRPLLLTKVRGIHSVSVYVRDINRRDWVGNRQARLAVNGGDIEEGAIASFLIESPARPDDDEILKQLPDEPYILFVGGLQTRKGIYPLLEAYARLDDAPPLVLIGYVGQDSPKEFPPNVQVIENVRHNQVMVAWEGCLFGVTPSLWPDPSPGVVREAMSVGKAMIGTDVGGITELIEHGTTGLLVPGGDVGALAEAMQTLIGDADARARMGAQARVSARQYDALVSVPRFEALYQRVVERGR